MSEHKISLRVVGKDEASQALNSVGKAIKTLGLAAAAKRAAEVGWELGTLSLQAKATEQRFVAFAGGTREAASTLSAMRAATDGTIDRMNAMQSASMLMSMGLATNADEMGRLTEMATRLGYQHQTAGERINDFALLLANQSVQRLDNFGISSGRVRQRIDELMASTEGLTREQAFLQATLEQGEVALERLGDAGRGQVQNVDRLDAAWSDFRVTLGDMVAPAVGETTGLLADLTQRMDSNLRATNELAEGFEGPLAGLRRFNRLIGGWDPALEKHMRDTALEMRAIEAGAAAAEQGFSDVGTAARGAAEDLGQVAEAAAEAGEASLVASGAWYEGAAALGEMQTQAFVKTQLDELKQSLDDGRISQEQFNVASMALLTTTGLLTAAEAEAQQKIDALREAFESGRIDAFQFAAGVNEAKRSLDNLPAERTVRLRYEVTGDTSAPGWSLPDFIDIGQKAEGGVVARGGPVLVGERGPEIVRLPAGSYVYDAHRTQGMRAQGGGQQVTVPVSIGTVIVQTPMDVSRLGQEIGQAARDRMLRVG